MATARLTADLLARKGSAQPTRKWLRDSSLFFHPATSKTQVAEKVKRKPATKTLRLDKQLNKQLKLLAVRTEQSQQTIMEEALRQYLHCCLEKTDCICGAED